MMGDKSKIKSLGKFLAKNYSWLFLFIFLSIFFIQITYIDFPSELNSEISISILSSMIGVEGILAGFIIVAFTLHMGLFQNITSVTNKVESFMGIYAKFSKKPITKGIIKQKIAIQELGKLPSRWTNLLIINLIIMFVNIFQMLFILIQIDTSITLLTEELTYLIYSAFFLMLISFTLVIISFLYLMTMVQARTSLEHYEKLYDIGLERIMKLIIDDFMENKDAQLKGNP